LDIETDGEETDSSDSCSDSMSIEQPSPPTVAVQLQPSRESAPMVTQEQPSPPTESVQLQPSPESAPLVTQEQPSPPTESVQLQPSPEAAPMVTQEQPSPPTESVQLQPSPESAPMVSVEPNDSGVFAVLDDVDNNGADNAVECRRKKRKCDPSKWKQNIRKRAKQSGEEYVSSRTGVLVQRRRMIMHKCGQCVNRCNEKLTVAQRENIFHNFWQITHAREISYAHMLLLSRRIGIKPKNLGAKKPIITFCL